MLLHTEFSLSGAHYHLHLPFQANAWHHALATSCKQSELPALVSSMLTLLTFVWLQSTHGENPFAKKSGGPASTKH